VMLFTRKASAAVRYNILCGLFFGFLLLVAGTYVYEWSIAGTVAVEDGGTYAVSGRGWLGRWIEALGGYCSAHAVPIVWGWLFIFMFKTLRMMGSLLYTQRIRNYGVSTPPGDWQQRLDILAGQLGIGRAVRLVESRIVKVPLVTGVFRPMIFMPMGLLTGLPAGEIEAVLLHELAHIKRNDYLVNFLQHLGENILFFNPGALWMSALLRDERENCCDDVAIGSTRDRVQFVRALISFKEYDLRRTRLANTFPSRKQQLLKRVSRIAHNTNKTLDPAEKVFLGVSGLLVLLLVAATSDHSRAQTAQMLQLPKGNNRIIQDRPRMAREKEVSVVTEELSGAEIRTEHMIKDDDAPVKVSPTEIKIRSAREQKIIAEKEAREKEFLADRAQQASAMTVPAMTAPAKTGPEMDQGTKDRVQAEKDREQAEKERGQAEWDRQQAERDRQQMERDREQALRDKKQAELDARQAMKDRQQAEQDRQQADRDRQQADRDRQQADRDREQALKDTRQSH